jgi:hypothetical protein
MPNLWRQFKALLPDSPLVVGKVAVRNGDGSLTVTTLDGGQLRVSGSASVGDRVFVRDGQITGQAPDLPTIDIEI